MNRKGVQNTSKETKSGADDDSWAFKNVYFSIFLFFPRRAIFNKLEVHSQSADI